jgi:hypothetical protein
MKMGKFIDWVRFDRLLDMWGLVEIELKQIIQNGHLPAYYLRYKISEHPDFIPGINPIPTPIQEWDIEIDLIPDRLVFKPEDIEAVEDKLGARHHEPSLQRNTVALIDTGDNVRWQDIKIIFIDEHNITIQWPNGNTNRKFDTVGFMNKKNRKPIKCWETFRDIADVDGTLSPDFSDKRTIEKRVQELNEKLQNLFPDLLEKPINFNKKDRRYVCRFQVESQVGEYFEKGEVQELLKETEYGFDPSRDKSSI